MNDKMGRRPSHIRRAAARTRYSQAGYFHYLNAQKRLLRDYARTTLGLGVRWRSSLQGLKSARGIRLATTPSSQWTQDELDCLYRKWGLDRPNSEELRVNACIPKLTQRDKVKQESSLDTRTGFPWNSTSQISSLPSPSLRSINLDEKKNSCSLLDLKRDQNESAGPVQRVFSPIVCSEPLHGKSEPSKRRPHLVSCSTLDEEPMYKHRRGDMPVFAVDTDVEFTSEDGDGRDYRHEGRMDDNDCASDTPTNTPMGSIGIQENTSTMSTLLPCAGQVHNFDESVILLDEILEEFGADLLPYLEFASDDEEIMTETGMRLRPPVSTPREGPP